MLEKKKNQNKFLSNFKLWMYMHQLINACLYYFVVKEKGSLQVTAKSILY